ncbi:MAG: hypothetical protein M3Q44_07580 [bacterium]|nr:hypothetical protein [bacterium]
MKSINVNEYILTNGHVDIASLREDLYDYFNTLHYMLSDTEFDHISQFARSWIDSHLENKSRIESSVKSKALEIASGDHVADYYLALLQRRDQLLAARDVFREYTSYLRDIFSEDRDLVMKALQAFDFDSGIYLRAIEYHKAREAAMQVYEESINQELADIERSIALGDSMMEPADIAKKKKPVTKAATTKKAPVKAKTGELKKRMFRKSL